MNALCRYLADQLEDVRFNWKVSGMEYNQNGWLISNQDGVILEADSVVLTIPPEQARQLLPAKVLGNLLDSIHMHPCWAVMAVLDRPLLEDFDAAFVNTGPLSWLASQPGSATNSHAWILHASAEWSQLHLEKDPGWVINHLMQEAKNLNASADLQVMWSKAHRWRYCMARNPLQAGSLPIPAYRLVLAGDWCHGSKAEGAYLSGLAAANALLGSQV
jgi:predicted NAD/FAD-dependent oxidoreductase